MNILRASIVLAFGAVSVAGAQQTLTASNLSVSADAHWDDFFGNGFGNSGVVTDLSGLDAYLTEHRTFTNDGFDGEAAADMSVAFSPPNPGPGGAFDEITFCANATSAHYASNVPAHFDERAYGESFGRVSFSVAAPTAWSWQGSWAGGSTAGGYLSRGYAVLALFDYQAGNYTLLDYRDSINGANSWNSPFSYGGLLNPGSYDVIWLASADQQGYYLNGPAIGDSWVSMCGSFRVPTPGAAGVLAAFAGLAASPRRR